MLNKKLVASTAALLAMPALFGLVNVQAGEDTSGGDNAFTVSGVVSAGFFDGSDLKHNTLVSDMRVTIGGEYASVTVVGSDIAVSTDDDSTFAGLQDIGYVIEGAAEISNGFSAFMYAQGSNVSEDGSLHHNANGGGSAHLGEFTPEGVRRGINENASFASAGVFYNGNGLSATFGLENNGENDADTGTTGLFGSVDYGFMPGATLRGFISYGDFKKNTQAGSHTNATSGDVTFSNHMSASIDYDVGGLTLSGTYAKSAVETVTGAKKTDGATALAVTDAPDLTSYVLSLSGDIAGGEIFGYVSQSKGYLGSVNSDDKASESKVKQIGARVTYPLTDYLSAVVRYTTNEMSHEGTVTNVLNDDTSASYVGARFSF